ncbi:hypothetical protein [Paractinoplanes hotanensis]|nr:hypothetical protein [Actinoplanes hotanensis]
MGTDAVIMLLVGAIGLWGTFAAAVWNFLRRSAAAEDGGSEFP